MSSHYVEVIGTPRPQPRPRLGKGGRVFNPPSADEWKRAVARACRDAKIKFPAGSAIALDVEFFLPVRGEREVGAPHLSTPDLDNLLKAVMDAMTTAGVWADDAQVFCLTSRKAVAGGPREPGATIVVTRI